MTVNNRGFSTDGVDIADQLLSVNDTSLLSLLDIIEPVGSIFSFGYNNNGELGLGDITSRSSPIFISGIYEWKNISGGLRHVLAVKTNGTLWGWGYNGQNALLGLNFQFGSFSAPINTGFSNAKDVSASGYHSLVVKTDGTLWSWGANNGGQLGLGNTTPRSSPVQVGSLTNWKTVGAGSRVGSGSGSSLAIKTDGTLWSWGDNNYGQLGLGNTTPRSSPVQVGSLTNWKQISNSLGSRVAAVKTDGTLWAWGRNYDSRLGVGDNVDRSSPTQIGTNTSWSKVSVKDTHSLAIRRDGSIWAWGGGNYGQLGLGGGSNTSPVRIGLLNNWKDCFTGRFHSIAIKTDGTLWAWGMNSSGQLGLGDITNRSSPVQVGTLNNWKLSSATSSSTLSLISGSLDG